MQNHPNSHEHKESISSIVEQILFTLNFATSHQSVSVYTDNPEAIIELIQSLNENIQDQNVTHINNLEKLQNADFQSTDIMIINLDYKQYGQALNELRTSLSSDRPKSLTIFIAPQDGSFQNYAHHIADFSTESFFI